MGVEMLSEPVAVERRQESGLVQPEPRPHLEHTGIGHRDQPPDPLCPAALQHVPAPGRERVVDERVWDQRVHQHIRIIRHCLHQCLPAKPRPPFSEGRSGVMV